MAIATPARANLALIGIPEASITKMNGARAAESVREDREKILSLRKVFVNGPRYRASGAGAGSLGEVESLRCCVIVVGTRRLSLPVCDKPCPHGREIRNSERCMKETPERMGKQPPEQRNMVTCGNQKTCSLPGSNWRSSDDSWNPGSQLCMRPTLYRLSQGSLSLQAVLTGTASLGPAVTAPKR